MQLRSLLFRLGLVLVLFAAAWILAIQPLADALQIRPQALLVLVVVFVVVANLFGRDR